MLAAYISKVALRINKALADKASGVLLRLQAPPIARFKEQAKHLPSAKPFQWVLARQQQPYTL